MNRKTTIQVLPILIGITLIACESKEKTNKNKVEITQKDSLSKEEFNFIFPPALTLVELFKSTGLTYLPGRINTTESNYNLKTDRLLNLGVYSTDLAYCAMNGKKQEANNLMKKIAELGKELGYDKIFRDKNLIQAFEKSDGSMESMEEIIVSVQEKIDDQLLTNEVEFHAPVHFAGAWVECLYLAIPDAQKNPIQYSVALAEQMPLLEKIVEALTIYPEKDLRIKEVTQLFQKIITNYESLLTSAKNNKPTVDENQMKSFIGEIEILRKKVVSPRLK